ncbi:hypothetical protein [Nonomuraea dietziae]|uniref:hypothetical protein n=1 Tax=Nonomuraea dietziae TaxID=65515 RepID=UPI003417D3FA
MTQPPPEAFPVAIYSGNRYATPETVRVEASEHALLLWIDGLCISVATDADDSRLQAAITTAFTITQSAEHFASVIRAELLRRERSRQAEPGEAARRAIEHSAVPASAPASVPASASVPHET